MAKSGNIQCHYDSSKNVHDISTVSLRINDDWIDHGGTANAHGACMIRYGTSTIHGGSDTCQSWSSVAKPWMIRRTTVHNSW